MAYIDQARKKLLAAEVAKVMPKGWKYTLAVRNHSTIVLTIRQAPVDLVAAWRDARNAQGQGGNFDTGYSCDVNVDHVEDAFLSPHLTTTFKQIVDALNKGNHDNSDIQSDYFDVGWYVSVQIGAWNQPFLHVVPPVKGHKTKAGWIPKPKAPKVPQWKLEKYLPADFATLSPGKKAAATKKAKMLVDQNG